MDDQRTDPTTALNQALLTFRIIGVSLGLGVTMFAVVAWFTNQQGPTAPAPADPTLMFAIVLALALGAVTAATALWRARVEPLLGAGGGDDPAARVAPIQSNVIIVWAIIEAAALFAVVVHYLYNAPLAGAVGVVLIWGALAATWPKREWVEPGG